jgi:hypothetical protein
MKDLETEPLIQTKSHDQERLVLEEQQQHYLRKHRIHKRVETFNDARSEKKGVNFNTYMIGFLFMSDAPNKDHRVQANFVSARYSCHGDW